MCTIDVYDELGKVSGKVALPAVLRDDVSTCGFWKQGTTAMFDVRIVNLDAGSCLCMMPKKYLAKAEK